MQLSQLLQGIFSFPAAADREVSGLALDSRQLRKGEVFLACPGGAQDGRQYIAAAIAQGAAAVLSESHQQSEVSWQQKVPIVPIVELPKKIGQLAARFYDYPTNHLRMIGVTGTNGKTSCSHFLAQSLQQLQIPCGILGTLGYGFYGSLQETGLTTPNAIALHKIFSDLAKQGAQAVAMEVSSHSIQQGRINDIPFELGLFTNLTQDHLDYHGDMATYAAVKKRFLQDELTHCVIINADEMIGREYIDSLAKQKPVFAYGLKTATKKITQVPTVYADQAVFSLQGIRADVHTPWGKGELSLPLIGDFNLSNALAVLTALCQLGISLEQALDCLSQLQAVPGRMQVLGGDQQPLVVVDYSHTPDALEKVLLALRVHCTKELICVFGCGGDRDRGKRPLMGSIAQRLADKVIVTNDNPRHEKPEEIAQQILQGMVPSKQIFVELDRSKAIQNSIQWAATGDCILIAGKGAERYQQLGDEKIPFSDVEKVRECLGE